MRTLDGFIAHRDSPGPIAFFLDTSSFSFLFKISFYIAQTIIGDTFVVRFTRKTIAPTALYSDVYAACRFTDSGSSGPVIGELSSRV